MNIRRNIFLLTMALSMMSCVQNSENLNPESGKAASEDKLSSKLASAANADIIPGGLLIKVNSTLAAEIEKGNSTDILKALAGEFYESISSFRNTLTRMPKNMKAAKEIGLDRWYSMTFDESIPVQKIAATFAAHPGVSVIQYNTTPEQLEELESYPVEIPILSRSASEEDAPYFNDPSLEKQWNLINNGDESFCKGAKAGADVGVKDAWKLTTGDPRIIVAVMDEGVYEMHPDLKNSLWTNEASRDGKDDDGNGYIDDIHGWNFHGGKALLEPKVEHGTHVAGIIAATNNNGIGISSIAGGSGNGDGVRIMSCQIFSAGAKVADPARVRDAFIYAADNGASIAQCSYGIAGGAVTSDKTYLEGIKEGKETILAPGTLEYEGIQYFIHPDNCNCEAIGQNLVIFAAGNDGADYSSYPGALPCCISVTAFGPDFLPSGYSNRGYGCNIAAPGGDKLGPNDGKEEPCQIISCGNPSQKAKYVAMHGTSMACPHVSGVAALGMSYALKIGKKFEGDEFKSLLLTSVQDIDQYAAGEKLYLNEPFDVAKYKGKMGTGAIDAYRLLMAIEGTQSEFVKVNSESVIDLKKYFGDTAASLTYLGTEISEETRSTLGLTADPTISNGVLKMTCGKVGSGKIRIKAIAGGNNLGGDEHTGGSEISREISILSRPYTTNNGGWF